MTQYRIVQPRSGWPGLDDLRREMDAVFGRFAGGPAGIRRGVFPAVNLYESTDAYLLTAELPGVSPDGIEISLEGSTVTLRGERKIDYSADSWSAHRLERQAGAFRRAIELPDAVDGDKVEAIQRGGVLMLKLPKLPERQPRRISIQAD